MKLASEYTSIWEGYAENLTILQQAVNLSKPSAQGDCVQNFQ